MSEWAMAHPYLLTLVLLAFAQALATCTANVVNAFYNAVVLARECKAEAPKLPPQDPK